MEKTGHLKVVGIYVRVWVEFLMWHLDLFLNLWLISHVDQKWNGAIKFDTGSGLVGLLSVHTSTKT